MYSQDGKQWRGTIYPEYAWNFMMYNYSKKRVAALKKDRVNQVVLVIGETQNDWPWPRRLEGGGDLHAGRSEIA